MALRIVSDELFAQLNELLSGGTIIVPESLVGTNGVTREELAQRAESFEFDYPSILVEMVDSREHFLLSNQED